MRLLPVTMTCGAALGLLLFASSTVGCSADEPGGATNTGGKADARVVGVYGSALRVEELPEGSIARLALADGQYLLFTAECIRSGASAGKSCAEEGRFTLSSANDRINLVSDRDGSTRSLPFAVLRSRYTEDGHGLAPKGLCLVGYDPRCPLPSSSSSGSSTSSSSSSSSSSGATLIVGEQQQLATPSQVLIQCRGNCAMTIRVNGQELTTTGEELTVTVPTPAP